MKIMQNEALDLIAENCNEKYNSNYNKDNFSDLVTFIETELKKETLVPTFCFESIKKSFYAGMKDTMSKPAFIEMEKKSTKKLIDYSFYNIENSEIIIDNIAGFILLNYSKDEILKRYFDKFMIKNTIFDTISTGIFVRIVYVFDMIKYQCFLMGDQHDEAPEKTTDDISKYKKLHEKLKIKQIALIYVYEYDVITRDNAKNIITKYGLTSGDKLYQEFIRFSDVQNRTGKPTPCTQKRIKNRISLIESVIQHLSEKGKQQAEKDLQKLNETYASEFE